jgi:hypothetical protein
MSAEALSNGRVHHAERRATQRESVDGVNGSGRKALRSSAISSRWQFSTSSRTSRFTELVEAASSEDIVMAMAIEETEAKGAESDPCKIYAHRCQRDV